MDKLKNNYTRKRQFIFPFEELGITVEETGRAMGYKPDELVPPIDSLIKEALEHAGSIIRIEGGLVLYDVTMDEPTKSLLVNGNQLRVRAKIFHELKGSEKVAAFLCTAGSKIGEVSRELMQKGNLLEGYIYDTIGSVTVEKAMDRIQESFRAEMKAMGYGITNRYSPGYCGWETAGQFELFRLFPSGFCHVTLNDSALMNPVKTVSGVIGIGKNVVYNEYNCDLCELVNCIYRKTNDIR